MALQPFLLGCRLLYPGVSLAHRSTMVLPWTAPSQARLLHHLVILSLTHLLQCLNAPLKSLSTTRPCSLPPLVDTTGTLAAPRVPRTHHPARRLLAFPGEFSAPARTAFVLYPSKSTLHPYLHATTQAHNSPNSHQRHTKGSCFSRHCTASHWWKTQTVANEAGVGGFNMQTLNY